MKRARIHGSKQIRTETAARWPVVWLAPVLILAVTAAVYYPALSGQFLWDDEPSTVGNPFMNEPGGLWRIWTSAGVIQGEQHYWPLTYSALWFAHRCWGGWTTGYHLLNLLLHCAIVVQIWRLMRRLELPGAAFAAALFALHPVHVEAVAWIICVKDLLATLFYLVAVEFFLNFTQRRGRKWLIGAAAATAAAMLSKSTPITLPAGLAILVWYRRGRIESREAVGIAVIAGVALTFGIVDLLVVRYVDSLGAPVVIAPDLDVRLLQAGRAFWFYLGKLVFPTGLSPIYPQWPIRTDRLLDWMPLAGAGAATAVLWRARRRIGRGAPACWLFFGLTLGPTLGVVHFYFLGISPAADRYQYLASIGPIVAAGASLGAAMKRSEPRRRVWAYAPVAAALVVLGALTWQQSRYYDNLDKLFSRAQLYAPGSPQAHHYRGIFFARTGSEATSAERKKAYAIAESEFRETVRLNPADNEAYADLGAVLLKQGRWEDALAVFRETIRKGHAKPEILANTAWLLATAPDERLRDPRLALQYAEQSIAMRVNMHGLNSLAAAQAANGLTDEAIATAEHALRMAQSANAHGMARSISRRLDAYRRSASIQPQ